jgi:hypothetical protein
LVAIHVLFVNLTVAANICHLDVQDGILLVHDDTHCACNVTFAVGVYGSHAPHTLVPLVAAVYHQLNVFHAFVGATGNVTVGCVP